MATPSNILGDSDVEMDEHEGKAIDHDTREY